MNIIIFGATGMVGQGVLLECIQEKGVKKILVIGRRSCGYKDDKIKEIVKPNLFDYSDIENELRDYDATFFCLGTSSVGMSEKEYSRITFDLTANAAAAIKTQSPKSIFIYVSGTGADSSEQGRVMWARVRGKIENHLLAAGNAYIFRPGYIQPMNGITSKTTLYRLLYRIIAPTYPLLKRLFPRSTTTTENVGKAMINAVRNPISTRHLENHEINLLADNNLK